MIKFPVKSMFLAAISATLTTGCNDKKQHLDISPIDLLRGDLILVVEI